eukprot:1711902-Rhodomonas_salina.1
MPLKLPDWDHSDRAEDMESVCWGSGGTHHSFEEEAETYARREAITPGLQGVRPIYYKGDTFLTGGER